MIRLTQTYLLDDFAKKIMRKFCVSAGESATINILLPTKKNLLKQKIKINSKMGIVELEVGGF